MELFKIILVGVLMSFLWHIAIHLYVVFHPCGTNMAVTEVLKDPRKYVRYEHMVYFLRNMVGFFFVLMLFIAACRGNVKFTKVNDKTEMSINADIK